MNVSQNYEWGKTCDSKLARVTLTYAFSVFTIGNKTPNLN